MPFCPKCGEATAIGMRFCPKCGADMWNAKPSQPVSERRTSYMLIGSILVILGVLSLAGGAIEISGICAKTISASALLNVPTCDQATTEFFTLLILGISFIVVGLILLRKRGDSKESQDDLSFLTEEQPRRTGLRGSFLLDELTINKEVSNVSPGVYLLGRKEGKTFYVRSVGRADVDVNAQLKEHIGGYVRFKFEYANSPEDAFRKECELYHDFRGPEGKLDNKNHPERPQGVAWLCSKCNIFHPQGVGQTTA
ncbi:MAG: zinc-ribbon domain-containing protein [Candidatus Bathyarchaeia archaeon]